MIERIQQIMDHEGIKPGEFAEQIGINRSAISHILNGRNKPSLDVVNRILNRYDTINSEWLLSGKGNRDKSNQSTTSAPAPHFIPKQQPTLFDEIPVIASEYKPEKKYSTENRDKMPINEVQNTVNEMKEVRIPTTKKITKLIIFYSDNTFDTFAPDKGIF